MTQGKTYANNEERYAAAQAADKDLSTCAVTETDNGAGWLKLQFGRIFFIHKIVIHYMFYTNWYEYDLNNWCAQNEDRFRSCVNNETNVDVSVYQGEEKQKACGTLQLKYGLEQSDQIYTLICNTNGNSVKLSKNTGLIAVYEMIVMGTGKVTEL